MGRRYSIRGGICKIASAGQQDHKLDTNRTGLNLSAVTMGTISQQAWPATNVTFYIGGWNEDIIYKIKGGGGLISAVIEQWTFKGIADSPHPDQRAGSDEQWIADRYTSSI